MASFDLQLFTKQLITESLFYDEEYGAIGSLSLVDAKARRECFIASYVPDDETVTIEEAIEWEEYDPDSDDDDIGYALAVESKEYKTFETQEEAAEALLQIAMERNLLPSVTLLFEEDEVV
jgi:hypothetical protein